METRGPEEEIATDNGKEVISEAMERNQRDRGVRHREECEEGGQERKTKRRT